MTGYFLGFLLLLSNFGLSSGKFLSGKIHSADNWVFVSRYSFTDDIGKLDFKVEFTATKECCPGIAYYEDDSWESAYQNNGMDCRSKISRAKALFAFENTTRSNNLSNGHYSMQCFVINGTNLRRCSGTLRLNSVDSRWWFFAISHCNSTQGLKISYEFTFTDGDYWEMSAEEKHVLENHLIPFGVILLFFATSLHFAHQLRQRDMFHRAYQLFMTSLGHEFGALLLDTVYRVLDVYSTVELAGSLLIMSTALHAISEILFQVLLVLLAFGWTITKARLSDSTQKKLTVFFSIYIFVQGVSLFGLSQAAFSPNLFRFLKLSRLLLPTLRIIAWIVFLCSAIATARQNPEKERFYMSFVGFYSIWFLVQPLFAFLPSILSEWKISAVYNHWFNFLLCVLGFGGLLYIMLPSRASRNFPFHVRTNEVEPAQDQYQVANFQHGDWSSNFNDNRVGSLETNPTTTGDKEIANRNRLF